MTFKKCYIEPVFSGFAREAPELSRYSIGLEIVLSTAGPKLRPFGGFGDEYALHGVT